MKGEKKMNTTFLKEVKASRDKYINLLDRKEKLESLLKEINKTLLLLSEDMANLWQEHALGELAIDSVIINAYYEPKFQIPGGEKESEARTKTLSMLEELGFGDQIKTYKSMHKKSFEKAMKEIPEEILLDMIQKGQVSVYNKPVIKIKKSEEKE